MSSRKTYAIAPITCALLAAGAFAPPGSVQPVTAPGDAAAAGSKAPAFEPRRGANLDYNDRRKAEKAARERAESAKKALQAARKR